ncbi:MAG: protein kinase [Lachnospiraceae bacterium]|nr:protein kinase [Lachnospiraceae bacterium]
MAADEKFPLALPQGTILAGQYVIDHALGQGGFGITYKATDHKTGQKVAVKEFFPETMATRTQTTVTAFTGERGESFAYGKSCFLQEAETLAEFIGNKNIVKVHSYFEENGTAYFVMDFVEGTSFDQYIKEHGGRISYEDAERILLPVMDALSAVHGRGIVHRDVTPDNIYITKDGTVKLLDFGAARYSLGDKSRSLDVVLKHGFAPKEQYTRHGKQGPFTDVYTVGASFYFAITGRRPPDSIDRMDEDDLVPPSRLGVTISPAKEAAILQAMNVQPTERFQTMAAFKQALLAGPATSAQPQQSTVQQRFFTAPVQQQGGQIPPSQVGAPPQMRPQGGQIPPSQFGSQTQRMGQNNQLPVQNGNKKKWILPVSIGGGVVALIAIIGIAVAIGTGIKNKEEQTAHYDTVDEPGNNNNNTGNSGYGTADSEPETETQELSGIQNVEILGNTPNNIMNYGMLAYDGTDAFLSYPGGHGLAGLYGNGDAAFLDEDGYVRCISIVGDTIYYINNGSAYSINRDGTDKTLIPELADYGSIATLYVAEDCFYIYNNNYSDTAMLSCIERGTGEVVGELECGESSWLTFLDGYVYYLQEDDYGSRELRKVPANDIGSESVQVLGSEDVNNCYALVSEEQYVYGIYSNEDAGQVNVIQYDVQNSYIACTYTFTDWKGTFPIINVCNQYVYFVFEEYSDSGDVYSSVYRFKAEPSDDSFDTPLVYEGEAGDYFFHLSVLEEDKSVAISSWDMLDNIDALVSANMDGSGEPSVLKDEFGNDE